MATSRANGNIDAAGQHHAGHSTGDAEQTRIIDKDVQKRLQMCEALIGINHTAHGIHHKK